MLSVTVCIDEFDDAFVISDYNLQLHPLFIWGDKVLAGCVSVSKTKFCTPGFFYEYFFADFCRFFLQVCRGQVVLISESPEQVGKMHETVICKFIMSIICINHMYLCTDRV